MSGAANMMRFARIVLCSFVAGGFTMSASGCTPKSSSEKGASSTQSASTPVAGQLKLESSAFAHEGEIPRKYTCQGDDISPPLSWSGLPKGTKSLVLIVDDPDAPDPAAPKMTWVHWVLYDIPPSAKGLAEAESELPPGTKQGLTSFKKTGYGGPCPPIGRHRYFHKLYALDSTLSNLNQPDKDAVVAAMKGHVIGQVELIGTYKK